MPARWLALIRCFDPAERALRGIGIGRKNYLFAGSDRGGERAATMYSLIETAKLNDVDPETYLRDVLERIADLPRSIASLNSCRGIGNPLSSLLKQPNGPSPSAPSTLGDLSDSVYF
jgi:hypothetical protein